MYKTHKAGTTVRLLTSGCNTPIENLAHFIEVVCAPLTENMKSRIKNTAHLLNIIDDLNNKGIPDNTMLISFDIANMFPCIDNNNGIEAVKNILETRKINQPSTKCVVEGLELCLYYNNSVFANDNLLQTNGTATGAPNSCSYADIAVSSIDEAVFSKMSSSFSQMLYFGRYRDDCFSLWCGTEEKLNEFFTYLNSINSDLKFTMEIGRNKLCFLDLEITLTSENKLTTSVYSKPTDSHLYLHADSCHNKSSIDGIAKGVALRLRRICSTDEEYEKKAEEYSTFLTRRKHDQKNVKRSFDSIRTIGREEARRKVTIENDASRIVFATKYNRRGPDIKAIIRNNSYIIEDHSDLKTLFPKRINNGSKQAGKII